MYRRHVVSASDYAKRMSDTQGGYVSSGDAMIQVLQLGVYRMIPIYGGVSEILVLNSSRGEWIVLQT